MKPQNRGGIWYLVRRVPKAYAHLDQRRFVKVTTGIKVVDDPRGVRAERVLNGLNDRLEQDWQDLAEGRDPEHRRALERATNFASLRGLPYASVERITDGDLDDLLKRLQMIKGMGGKEPERAVEAILGGVPEAEFLISDLLAAFEDAQAAPLTLMSEDQLHRWRLNKKRAIRIAKAVLGDKPVRSLTRADGIAFRKHFQKRIIDGELSINSANIEIGHFTKMLRVVELERHIGIPLNAFAHLSFEGGERQQRPPFPTDFIQDRLLAPGALSGLDLQARCIVYATIDTGMRPSETANLLPKHIKLDAEVPHVQILPEGRKLKNKPSRRDMPLVGCALAAFRACPEGFPNYRGKGTELSHAINEYLTDMKLRPTPEHSLYSLRHSFEDRLTALDPPDKIIGRLMGHKGYREKYGDGPSLDHLQSWVSRIALLPPDPL